MVLPICQMDYYLFTDSLPCKFYPIWFLPKGHWNFLQLWSSFTWSRWVSVTGWLTLLCLCFLPPNDNEGFSLLYGPLENFLASSMSRMTNQFLRVSQDATFNVTVLTLSDEYHIVSSTTDCIHRWVLRYSGLLKTCCSWTHYCWLLVSEVFFYVIPVVHFFGYPNFPSSRKCNYTICFFHCKTQCPYCKHTFCPSNLRLRAIIYTAMPAW